MRITHIARGVIKVSPPMATHHWPRGRPLEIESMLADQESSPVPTVAAVVREQTGLSWSRARRLCAEGRVTLDGVCCTDPAMRVAPGRVVDVSPHGPKLDTRPLAAAAIVFCDGDVVVVDKPVGMLSVADEPGSKDTLADYTRTLIRQLKMPGDDVMLGVVHRLDKETSGLMIFARTSHAKLELAEQFFDHSIERAYHAIAHGIVPATRMDTHLLTDRGDGTRGSHGYYRREAGPPPADAKRAITHIVSIAALTDATLVECRLETGRQHQIRIHLAELGHPLLGERVYIRDYRSFRIPAPRPMLHARTLGFVHPRTGQRMVFERDPPEDFETMLASLRPSHEVVLAPDYLHGTDR